MRKILIGFLIVLLVIMAYLMIFKGLELGDFKVLSASQIVEENDRLTKEISDTEELRQVQLKLIQLNSYGQD